MEQTTVKKTTDFGLCTSCSSCKGICPRDCIHWISKDGMFLPEIDKDACISCGLCASVCPGLGHSYEPREDAAETVTGQYLACFNAWSKDPNIRHTGASGGVITTMVKMLLEQGLYDSVFCLDTYDYRHLLETKRYTREEWPVMSGMKSRYLPVSHEQAIHYMKEHRQERIILIATSCALRGILAVIDRLKLNRENYLLIGLFCDKVFNYNVISYFEDRFCQGQRLEALHFKNKESGGWPGDMKMYPENGEAFYVPIGERGRVKEYFMPERCLYCVDKLNVFADISLGDNYTGSYSSELGSNSVMIRSNRGMVAWEAVQSGLEAYPVDVAQIQKAQYLEGRLNNLYFGDLKSAETGMDLNAGIPRELSAEEFRWVWKRNAQKLSAGAQFNSDPSILEKQMRRDNKKPNPVIVFAKRCYYFAKRKLARLVK